MNYFYPLFGNTLLAHTLSALVIVLCGYVIGIIARIVFRFLTKRLADKTKTILDNLILDVLRQRVVSFCVLASAYIAAIELHHGLVQNGIPVFLGFEYIEHGIYVLMVLAISYIVSRLIDSIVIWYLHDIASKTDTRLDDELAPFINRVLNILVFVMGIIVILDHFGQNISSLVVSLGVGSLAIALAAQETLQNMIAGFVLMVDRPFRVGDRIRLPNGVLGNVAQIGIRSTKVINDNDIMIITPNAEIVKSQIQNLSYPNDVVRFDVDFAVAFGTDLDRMSTLICAAVNAEPDVVDHGRTEVRIIRFNESGIDCQLFVRIKDPTRIPRRYSDMLRLIYKTLGNAEITIPYPQRVLHLADANEEALREFSRFPKSTREKA